MKSKKIVALALTAAMAISMASMTAFAATATVKSGVELWEQTATVKLAKDDLNDEGNALKDGFGVADLKLPTLPNTAMYKFLGWSTDEQNKDKYKENTDKTTVLTDETAAGIFTKKGEGEVSSTLYPVYRLWDSDEEAAQAAKDAENKAKADAEDAARKEKLEAMDAAHSAVNNAFKDDETKSEPATKAAKVTDITADNDGHSLKVAGVAGNEIAFVYEVGMEEGWKLVKGMNARVTLKVSDKYDLNNYKVAVYHIKDACYKQKVTGLVVDSHTVTFWAGDFSEYVMVLTPKDVDPASAGTNNPGTGDFSAVPVALLAAAALGATGFVAYKKRKAE